MITIMTDHDNSQNRINNRYKNYSQSPYRNKSVTPIQQSEVTHQRLWKNPTIPCSHKNNGTKQILNKPFKPTFHITIKHNIHTVYIFKYIPTINILNSKIHIKDKYKKNKKHSLDILSKIERTTTIFDFTQFIIKNGNI